MLDRIREYYKKNLVIYHGGNCSDGFGAAYSAWKQLGDTADYVPMEHNTGVIPNVKDKNVYILDFSFPKDIYEKMLEEAQSVQLLDHHKTAMKSLCNCKGCFFDLNKSGAVLAWEHFNPHTEIPHFIRLIQDGDLWKFKYEETKPFYSAIHMLEKRFAIWSKLEDKDFLNQFIENGKLIQTYYHSQLKDIIKEAKPVEILGHKGLMINATSAFASELGSTLAKESGTFALVWSERKNAVKCSLRSVDSFDCSVIAQAFGGGGHPQASAFTLKNLHEFNTLVTHGELKQEPFHKHNSEISTYLGSETRFGDNYDFYYDPQNNYPTVIARYGSDGEYISGLSFIKSQINPENPILEELKALESNENPTFSLLATATRLSIEKDLLNESLQIAQSETSDKKKMKP